MKILITGGSGFLGGALAPALSRIGVELTLLQRESSPIKQQDLAYRAEIIRFGNIQEIGDAISSTKPDAIIHTAGIYGRNGETWNDLIDSNLKLGLEILSSLRKTEKKVNFVNTSTALDGMVSAYSLSKNQFSEWGKFASGQYPDAFRFIDIKLQHIFGAGDSPTKFSSHVIKSCINNVPTLELTHGEQRRDFIYIEDAVSAYLNILENCNAMGNFEAIDVGTGIAPKVRDFVETVHRLTSSNTKLLFGSIPYRSQEPLICIANTKRLKAFGWSPQYDLETALKMTIEKEMKK